MIDILEEAAEIISGARQEQYGSPEDSFQKIADFWSTYLDHPISAQDVSLMMVMLKVARVPDGTKASRDTMVDIAGYAAIGSTLHWS
tara:strand:+ start:2130 stop:2390 length:261 start_codon:yes stop_codon:yes gene_type:complete